MKNKRLFLLCGLMIGSVAICVSSYAHVDGLPSVHDTVVKAKKRLLQELPQEELLKLDDSRLKSLLTDEERVVLGSGHIRFSVNVPVAVRVIREAELRDNPLWLADRGFERQELQVHVDREAFDVWEKSFEPGRIGLGVNSLRGADDHYSIAVAPLDSDAALEITEIYPGACRLGTLERRARVYVDSDETFTQVPDRLVGSRLIMPMSEWRSYGELFQRFQKTRFPAKDRPDQIVLTWSDDPQTTQTIQWRTSTNVTKGAVAYRKRSEYNRFRSTSPRRVKAETFKLETLDVVNDPICNRHTVTLRDLEPDTTYLYSVGDGSRAAWSELAEFTTAPGRVEPFSFIYMGDAQNGLDRWGTLIQNAFRERPDISFFMMAGDLVNRGNERADWDDFFYNAEGIFDRRTLAPSIGNHECQDGPPLLYLDLFTLRTNGPKAIEPERAYAFEYSNALFVVLDSNVSPEEQAQWLEEQLADTDATWKFVMYHHPAYSSKGNRNNPELRAAWLPLFDKYQVTMALQGHDHAYLRTYPMRADKPVDDPSKGTTYIVSNSGMKFYSQGEHSYTARGLTNLSMYQVLDIQISGNRLLYRAYDIDGELKDEIVIEK